MQQVQVPVWCFPIQLDFSD